MQNQNSKNWRKVKLGDVIEKFIDYRGKTPKKESYGIPLVTAKIIKNGFIQQPSEFVSVDTYEKWMTRGFPKTGDVLLTTEAPLGEVAIVKNDHIALAQRVILLRSTTKYLLNAYLKYWLQSDMGKNRLYSKASGSTVMGIRAAELRKVIIDLPSLETQQKIASVLSAYDDLVENNNRRIKILEEMAQAIYKEWFVNFRFPGHETVKFVDSPLGKIPEGWKVRKTTDVILVNPKTEVSKNGEKPFVSMATLSTNSMLIKKVGTRMGNSGSKFKNGDTLFARITPCLQNGKTGFVQFLRSDEQVAFGSTEFIVLRSLTLCPEYVYLLARSDQFRNHAIQSMTGATGRQRVQEKCFDTFLIAQPPEEVLNEFQKNVQHNFSLCQKLLEENIKLKETRDLLIPKLVSGEINV